MATKTKENEIVKTQGFGLVLGNDLIMPRPTYSIRNNCQLGMWMKSDGVTPIGKTLTMGILNIIPFYGDLGKTKAANWLQLWGVSESIGSGNIVFCTYIKGSSLTTLGNTVLDCALEGKNPADVLFESSFQAKSNEYGSYYTLGFEPKERAQDDPMREKIERFLSMPQNWLDTNIPNTIFPSQDLDQEDLTTVLEAARKVKAD